MFKYILLVIPFIFIACSNDDSVDKSVDISSTSTYSGDNFDEKLAHGLYYKCVACHGLTGNKVAPGSVGNVLINKLSKEDIVSSLKQYRARTLSRGGSYAIMYLQTSKLSDEDIEILGEYISNFPK